jgi:uncharacterized lipoprotein YmbA
MTRAFAWPVASVVVAWLAVGLAVGCGTSREPSYFALEPRPGSARGPAATGAPRLIELRRPSVAGYLDRADIVTRVHGQKLQIDTGERWAEPLGEMISRVLARDLSSRLGGSDVFMESGAISAEADATVAVDVLAFHPDGSGRLRLVAQVAVDVGKASPTTATTRVETFELSRSLRAVGDTSSLVDTMSGLLAELSDRIADLLRQRALEPQGSVAGGGAADATGRPSR